MRKIIVMLLLAVPVAGCVVTATKNDIRSEHPPVEYSSANSSKVVATCLVDAWESVDNSFVKNNTKAQLRPTANGFTAWVEENVGNGLSWISVKDHATIVADIDDTPGGSITRYYTSFKPGNVVWQPPVDKCLGGNIAKVVAAPESTTSGASTSSGNATSQKLRDLQALRKDGVITEDEFQSKKKQLLEKL